MWTAAQKVACVTHWRQFSSWEEWNRSLTSSKATWAPPATRSPEQTVSLIYLKTQPLRACGNGLKSKQQRKKIWKFSNKGKHLYVISELRPLCPPAAPPGEPALPVANPGQRAFVLGRAWPQHFSLPSYLLLNPASGWEGTAPFFCPDPTHELGAPSWAWRLENTGAPAAVTLAHVWFISPKTYQSHTHSWCSMYI